MGKMKVCCFSVPGEKARALMGIVQDGRVFETAPIVEIGGLLAMGSNVGERIRATGKGHDIAEVALHAPIPRPGKIVATIVNTKGMLGGDDVRLTRPRLDMKAPSTVIGQGETIIAPRTGIRPEVELAVVVGVRLAQATAEQAKRSIMGYTVLNDVTAPDDSREDAYEAYRRDQKTGKIEKKHLRGPLFRSKNHDTFCPLGPWMVTADEMKDTAKLRMTTKFDEILVQDGTTAEYIFAPEEITSYVSGFLTLEPGDLVSCGSVGWTREALGSLDPTEFLLPLRPGTLRLEIEGIGELMNPVEVES